MSKGTALKSKFCVLTTPLFGSTWFTNLLQSNPAIGVFGEVFLDAPLTGVWHEDAFLTIPRYHEYAKSISSSRPVSTFKYFDLMHQKGELFKSIGFKMMYGNLTTQPEIIIKLFKDRYRIIHLVRNNLLKIHISEMVMKFRRTVHTKEKIDLPKIYIDSRKIINILKRKQVKIRIYRRFLRMFPFPVLEINYESLLDNTEAVIDTVTDFLSVPRTKNLSSVFKKLSTGNLRERIANFDEISDVLSNTEFYPFLTQ